MPFFFFVALVGCDIRSSSDEAPAPAIVDNGEFSNQLLEIAKSYETYEPFHPDTSHKLQVAPAPCASSAPAPQPSLAMSASKDSPTHGRKLFTIFVKELADNQPSPSSYPWLGPNLNYAFEGRPNPIGQVVVKEAWTPEEVDPATRQKSVVRKVKIQRDGKLVERETEFIPYAKHGDQLLHAVSKAGLFIMFKRDPSTPGTDEGWVYGTVTSDCKQVLSVGLVESCMGCHRDAPHDRLFGHSKK